MWCTAESAGVLPARSWIMPAPTLPGRHSHTPREHSQGALPGKPRGKPGSKERSWPLKGSGRGRGRRRDRDRRKRVCGRGRCRTRSPARGPRRGCRAAAFGEAARPYNARIEPAPPNASSRKDEPYPSAQSRCRTTNSSASRAGRRVSSRNASAHRGPSSRTRPPGHGEKSRPILMVRMDAAPGAAASARADARRPAADPRADLVPILGAAPRQCKAAKPGRSARSGRLVRPPARPPSALPGSPQRTTREKDEARPKPKSKPKPGPKPESKSRPGAGLKVHTAPLKEGRRAAAHRRERRPAWEEAGGSGAEPPLRREEGRCNMSA